MKRARLSLPMPVTALTVPSPGRFSITNGLPSRWPNFGATTRVTELSSRLHTRLYFDRVRAQDYPVRTVTIIVPFAVGGTGSR